MLQTGCHSCTLDLSHPAVRWGRQLPSSPPRASGEKIEGPGQDGPWKVRRSTKSGDRLPLTAFSSSPQGHPFIVQFNDGNATVVSMWVCRALEERRSQQGTP